MYSDDEKRSIRSEMNRDAAPSPGEARRQQRRRLAEQGCRECDEDDPDNLGRYFVVPYETPDGHPEPDPETAVLCEDHADEVDL